jgi:hypothetical protein
LVASTITNLQRGGIVYQGGIVYHHLNFAEREAINLNVIIQAQSISGYNQWAKSRYFATNAMISTHYYVKF